MRPRLNHPCGLRRKALFCKPLQPMSVGQLVGYTLWGLPPLLQLGIAALMRRRRLEREFPLFLTYTLVHLFRFPILYFIYHLPRPNYVLYFYSYWAAEVVTASLSFAVIHEIYKHVFRRYDALRTLGNLMFRWTLAVMFLIAAVVAASSVGDETDRILRGVMAFDQSVAVVLGGLIFFLFLFTSYFGLTWRDFAFGIAIGLALYTTVDLAAMAIRIHWGAVANNTVSLVRSAAYNCSVLVWVAYCWRKEPARKPVASVPTHDLERWNAALLELAQR